MSKGRLPAKTVSFVSQKGGVGKSALARLFAVGAAHRGQRALLADFDLDQLTCVEWNAARLQAAIEPEIDTRAFKSLKKLRKAEVDVDFIVADTRGLADDLTKELAEESDVVFLPTGTSLRRPAADAGAGHEARQARRRRAHRRRPVQDRPLGAAARPRRRGDRRSGVRAAVGAMAAARRLPGRSRRRTRRARDAQPLLARSRRADGRSLMRRAHAAQPRTSEAAE